MSVFASDQRRALRDAVRARLRKLVFRRVGSVQQTAAPYSTRYYADGEAPPRACDLSTVTQAEWEKHVEQRCRRYHGFTTRAPLRDNDPHPGEQAYFGRREFAHFNPVTLALEELTPARESALLDGRPRVARPLRDVPPRPGDLVCGYLQPAPGQRRPKFARWFVCSEQFFRAWTLCMYDAHSSFARAETKRCGARAYWLSGNRLMTNSYAKWRRTVVGPTGAERHARYWHQRTELASRLWVHVYCAVVLLARYGERPGAEVPTNRGGVGVPAPHALAAWDLPANFVDDFLAEYLEQYVADEQQLAVPADENRADDARVQARPPEERERPEGGEPETGDRHRAELGGPLLSGAPAGVAEPLTGETEHAARAGPGARAAAPLALAAARAE